jgi:hypothetical protein
MSSKFRIEAFIVLVIFVLGGGMIMVKAQSPDSSPLYLPLVMTGGTPQVTPTPSKTSAVTPTPVVTPTDVPQPIVEYLHPVEDANVAENGPDNNDGNPNTIWVGTYGGVERGLVKFDLSSIPTGSHLIIANLDMEYEMRAGGSSPVPTFNITVYRNSAAWDELSVTWNSRPSIAEAYGSASFSTFGSKTFDMINLVQAWVDGTYPNYGVTLAGGANYNNYSVGFCPREGGTWQCYGSSGSPILTVIYDQP